MGGKSNAYECFKAGNMSQFLGIVEVLQDQLQLPAIGVQSVKYVTFMYKQQPKSSFSHVKANGKYCLQVKISRVYILIGVFGSKVYSLCILYTPKFSVCEHHFRTLLQHEKKVMGVKTSNVTDVCNS